MKTGLVRALVSAAVLLFPLGCSDDEATQNPEEPVVASDEAPKTEAELPKADEGAPGADAIPDGTGELTTEDTGAMPAPGTLPSETPVPDAGVDNPPPVEGDLTTPPDSGNVLGDQSAPPPAKGKKAKAAKGKVTRYVNATMLNVRGSASGKGKVVRRVLGGEELSVEIHGRWAKIKNGEWVRSKYLSESPTAKVSQEEADAAWKGGGGKAVKKKGGGKKKGKKKK